MGLYLCYFVGDEEMDGVEIGSYQYFGIFRDYVNILVENYDAGSVCPKLIMHSDCDGEWSTQDCKELLKELEVISEVFKKTEPQDAPIEMKKDIFNFYKIKPKTLYDCFIDVDGNNIIERLAKLCLDAIDAETKILFQ